MQKIGDRAHGIGPATFYASAVTPKENPQNQRVDPETGKKVKRSGDSHHIIQMRYSRQKKDPTLAVQLLVNDGNGYITAKRVRRRNVWGGWQQLSDIDGVEVPEFLNAQVVDLPASHNMSVKIGGSMEAMFYGLVGPVERKKAAMLAIQRAIILFCEAFRFRSVLLEMLRRMLSREQASGLSDELWTRIKNWKTLSLSLLELGKYGRRLDAELAKKLVGYAEKYGLTTFEELITEVRVLLYSDEILLTNPVQKMLAHNKAGMGIQDPKFP